MKGPTLAVLPYRHSKTHRYYLDLHAFKQGRKFFTTKAEAKAERQRQITTLERHGREAIGLPQSELSDFVNSKKGAVHSLRSLDFPVAAGTRQSDSGRRQASGA